MGVHVATQMVVSTLLATIW